jgi:hypothetical protein
VKASSVDQFLMVMSMFEAFVLSCVDMGKNQKDVLVASCRNDMTHKKISLEETQNFVCKW